MAVYERIYRSYEGERTAVRTRFLVLPEYAYQDVFSSKAFVGFLVLCMLVPLAYAIVIYLPHNLKFLEIFQLKTEDLLQFFDYGPDFFQRFLRGQGMLAFVLAFVVGPALVSADLRNNGLPLYLARPFSRVEYVLGKCTILIVLMSAITWLPGLALFALQAYLGGGAWISKFGFIVISLLLASWIWIVVLCLLSLALSAYVKWKPLARAAMFGMFFVMAAAGEMINLIFRTEYGRVLNIWWMVHGVIWPSLFRVRLTAGSFPLPLAVFSVVGFCALCLLLLSRRLRAYEVVK